MKVTNMTSSAGNKVPNQFIITDRGFEYFQSYETIIARRKNGKVVLDRDKWDYSVTTMKYLNMFLGVKHLKKRGQKSPPRSTSWLTSTNRKQYTCIYTCMKNCYLYEKVSGGKRTYTCV